MRLGFGFPLHAGFGWGWHTWRFDWHHGGNVVYNHNTYVSHSTTIANRKQLRTKPAAADSPVSPLANLLSSTGASESAVGNDPILIQGYYFRALATQPASGSGPRPGGHAAAGLGCIAYPAEYRSAGVMTFVALKNDVVYEKDLGPNTLTLAAGMGAFHKDPSWRAANE
jgi:hypothetical protein